MWTSFDFLQHFKGWYKGESYDPGLSAPPGIFSAFPISSQPTRLSAISLLIERLLVFFYFCEPVFFFFFFFFLVLGVLGVFVLGFLFSFGGFGGFYNNISTRLLLGCGDS